MVVKGDSFWREGREKVATKRRKRKLIIGLSTKTKVCFCTSGFGKRVIYKKKMTDDDDDEEEEEERGTTTTTTTTTTIEDEDMKKKNNRKGNKTGKMGKCQMCEKEEDKPGKYRCPKCLFISCSLECVNKHKVKFSCDGKRDRFKFVNLKEMEDKHVTSDFRFLEEATEVLDRAKRKRMKSSLNNNKNNNGNKNDNIGQNKNKNNKRKRNGNKNNNNNNNTGNIQTATTKVVVGVAAAAI